MLTGTPQLDICLESNPTANLFLRARTHYNSIYGPRHRTAWTACRGRSAAGTLAAAMRVPPSDTNSSTDSRRCTPPTHTPPRACVYSCRNSMHMALVRAVLATLVQLLLLSHVVAQRSYLLDPPPKVVEP